MNNSQPPIDQDWDISDLVNPNKYQESVEILSSTKDELMKHLKLMLKIRLSEKCLAKGRENGVIGGPVHLGAGQEAIAVGVSNSLRTTDRIFGAHRSHSHVIAQGASIQSLFAEVLGKNEGLSKGMGGSMHLWDQPNGFYGSVPIVAGTVSLAVGAGLAAKIQGTDDIGVVYLGDGAVEEGVVHESLNFASIMNVPIMFVVENNLFASHMHISQRQPFDSTARFASANKILYEVIDGNNVVNVCNVASNLINKCREEKKPVFLEAVTYRQYGHVDWRSDIDVGVNRSTDDLEKWHKRDPIKRLFSGMLESSILTEQEFKHIESEIENEVETAWNNACNASYPTPDALLDRVYAKQGKKGSSRG